MPNLAPLRAPPYGARQSVVCKLGVTPGSRAKCHFGALGVCVPVFMDCRMNHSNEEKRTVYVYRITFILCNMESGCKC